MQTNSIKYGNTIIDFKLVFKDRKTLGICVMPDQSVLVQAPLESPVESIISKIKKRAPWILKQQSYFLSFHPLTPPRRYIGGETHLYLGRQYRLKVIENSKNKVRLIGKFLEVYTEDKKDIQKTKEQVTAWYMDHARNKISEYVSYWVTRFTKYNVKPKQILFKKMTKRWGSCTPNGIITLNTELIKAPKGCIEYVIVHELCHLVFPNHSKSFLKIQTVEMPDWEKWKNRLEKFMA